VAGGYRACLAGLGAAAAAPSFAGGGRRRVGRLVGWGVGTYLALACPILDLAVLAILIRLTADLVYNGLSAAGSPDRAQAPQRTSFMSPPQTVALGIGALTAPVLLAVGARRDGIPKVLVLAVTSIIVNVLVIWRILLLLSTVQHQSYKLAALSRTDALTRLPNRRSRDFQLVLAAASHAAGTPLTIAMANIDSFKYYNDAYGHLAGMRRAAASPVTVSTGYAEDADTDSILDTVERAEQALYSTKTTGRGRVERAPTLVDRETALEAIR
jgi:hypothetical protein